MKNYSIICKVTGTDMDGNLTLSELRSTLINYFNEDFAIDIDEVIKFCQIQEISLLNYFIDGQKFDRDVMHVIDRYEILDNSGEVLEIDEVAPAIYDVWAYHWFYDNDCPRFMIIDQYSQIYIVRSWDRIKESFNWSLVDINELMAELLKTGQYIYKDMAANDSFEIRVC